MFLNFSEVQKIKNYCMCSIGQNFERVFPLPPPKSRASSRFFSPSRPPFPSPSLLPSPYLTHRFGSTAQCLVHNSGHYLARYLQNFLGKISEKPSTAIDHHRKSGTRFVLTSRRDDCAKCVLKSPQPADTTGTVRGQIPSIFLRGSKMAFCFECVHTDQLCI